jgi:hypothetical protein
MTKEIEQLLLDKWSTCSALGCSPSTLWRNRHLLEVVRFGRSIRYTAESVRKLADELPRVEPSKPQRQAAPKRKTTP